MTFNNKPVVRTQDDGQQEQFSDLSGIDFSDDPGVTRQEFAEEADVNYILDRFGIHTPTRQVQYGETNFDIDLHSAFGAAAELQAAWYKLPQELKDKYPSMEALLLGIENGEIEDVIVKKQSPKERDEEIRTRVRNRPTVDPDDMEEAPPKNLEDLRNNRKEKESKRHRDNQD